MTTKIEWTEKTWNPVTGCTKISAGCKNCYAERMAKRLQAMGQAKYAAAGFSPTCHYGELDKPYHWKKPRRVFVCSMGDLFHKFVTDSFIRRVFHVMATRPQHIFQVLTKRPERMARVIRHALPNVWVGTTVENRSALERIEHLREVPARVRFLSIEPLLDALLEDPGDLDLAGISWVIVGGESGPGARPIRKEWVLSIRDQCQAAGVPFFFKQWGGTNKKKAGRLLEGRTWDEMPRETLRR